MEQQQQLAGTRQRTVRTEEQILSILDEYDKSGYSVKDYCEVNEEHPESSSGLALRQL